MNANASPPRSDGGWTKDFFTLPHREVQKGRSLSPRREDGATPLHHLRCAFSGNHHYVALTLCFRGMCSAAGTSLGSGQLGSARLLARLGSAFSSRLGFASDRTISWDGHPPVFGTGHPPVLRVGAHFFDTSSWVGARQFLGLVPGFPKLIVAAEMKRYKIKNASCSIDAFVRTSACVFS